MSKKKPRIDNSIVLFDVFYEDGSRASNRKVPGAGLGGLDGDEPARIWIEEQEQKIAALSGRQPRVIDRIVRSAR